MLRPPSGIAGNVHRAVSDYLVELYSAVTSLVSSSSVLDQKLKARTEPSPPSPVLPATPVATIPATPPIVSAALGLGFNPAITPATKTKVTYDAKGLITSGANATTADIGDSTNKRYVTDAELAILTVTSGVNTGDQRLSILPIRKVTANTSASATTDEMILADATSNDITVTLPNIASVPVGQYFDVKKIDSSSHHVYITGNANIDGLATQDISAQYVSLTVQSDGTVWWLR